MKSWQKNVADFVATKNVNVDVQTRMLDLVAELGELSKEALKGTHYGRKRWQTTAHWEPKLGEVLFSLICVANLSEVDLDHALKATIAKYDGSATLSDHKVQG